jgi:uncharacterized delta-60 repeat protein
MKLIPFIVFIFISFSFFSQTGDVDLSFNPSDFGFGSAAVGANSSVKATAIQSDGKVILVGNFTSYNTTLRNRIARVNTNGRIDSTFNIGTGANDEILTCVIQNDGKIIIGGNFTTYNGVARNHIARLNADGTLDLAYNSGSGTDFAVYSLSLQSDGKLLLGGIFTTYNSVSRNNIARVNIDGTLDLTFNPGYGADYGIFTISKQSNGKIIIGGSFTSYNGTSRNNLARINTDGSLDLTFNIGNGTNNTIYTSAVQSDGKIIIGGDFTSYNSTARNRIVRINTDGTVDITFNMGTGLDNSVFSSSIQGDGKIIIGGNFTTYNGTTKVRIARINLDGTLDASFISGAGGAVFANALQLDGKIIIGGDFTAYGGTFRNRLVRLNPDGTLDLTFNLETGANNTVYASALQSDGKIIIGGKFTNVNGIARNGIARLNTDGSLDLTFDTGTGFTATGSGAIGTVKTISIQTDGKIIIGGAFSMYNGTARSSIARLNSNGSLDLSFNPGGGSAGGTGVNCSKIQTDGKIIIGGGFTSYNGTLINRIARLNSDGSIDLSFNPGTGPQGVGGVCEVTSLSIQSNGKIIIGGINMFTYNGVSRNGIARINSNGSLDLTFNPGTGVTGANGFTGTVYSILIQTDGKIIIGGGFYFYNDIPANSITRLNTDGTCDLTFNFPFSYLGSSTQPVSYTMLHQSNGQIIVGGKYRINDNGTLDDTFQAAPDNVVYTSLIQDDSKIIVGGSFTSINNVGRNCIARLHNNIINTTAFGPTSYCPSEGLSVSYTVKGTFLPGNVFSVELSDETGSFSSPISIGSINSITDGIISANLPNVLLAGNGYRLRVISSSPVTNGSTNGINLTIKPLPIISANSSATEICEGDNITLTSSGTASTYSWLGGVIEGVSFIPPIGSNSYIVSGTNTSTGCSNSDTITIIVNSLPAISASSTQTAVCVGTSIMLTVTGGFAGTFFSWSNGVVNGVSFTPSIGTTNYVVTGTNTTTGCSNNDTITIIVNPLPLVTANSTQTTICEGESITLTGSGSDTYSWSNGVIDGVSFTPNVGLTTFLVTGLDSQTGCANNASISIEVNPLPIVTAQTTQNNVCEGSSIILTGSGANSYSWNNGVTNGVGFIPSIGITNYAVTGTETTTGCSNTANIAINVTPLPNVSASDNGNGTISASNGNSYAWINCQTGDFIAGETFQTYIPSSNGSYAAIVWVNGCSDTTNCIFISNIGVQEIQSDEIQLFPNPTNNNVTIKMVVSSAFVVITDIHGKILEDRFISNGEIISLSNYESGVYIFQLNTDKKSYTSRVVKN